MNDDDHAGMSSLRGYLKGLLRVIFDVWTQSPASPVCAE